MYRIWGKVRREACVEWEAAHNDGTDYAVAGQSAQRAAWDFALSNEAVEASQGHTAARLGDLGKCYELTPFRFILEEAKAMGFPAVVAKLAVGMYASRRRIAKTRCTAKR